MFYALVDGNCFYASCERLFRPSLRGRPVVVLSNNDGNVVTRTDEAKAVGIKMGVPLFQIRDLVEREGVVCLSSNYPLYADLSRRVVQVLSRFCGEIEVYSIDESFLALTLPVERLEAHGRSIRAAVLQEVGIPTCCGIGPTKALAKMANRHAKKSPGLDGVCLLLDGEREVLEKYDVEDVWGIGSRIGARLHAAGVRTAWDFREANPRWVRQEFGVVGERLLMELRGVSCLSLEEVAPPKKGIICSRSFGRNVIDLASMEGAVSEHCARAGEKLRAQDSVCSYLQVFIRTSPFTSKPKYANAAGGGLLEATSDTGKLITAALGHLRGIFREGFDYQKAGVFLDGIAPATSAQLSLFGNEERPQERKQLLAAIDKINRGGTRVFWGYPGRKKSWGMRQERRSPSYTTRWEDILTV